MLAPSARQHVTVAPTEAAVPPILLPALAKLAKATSSLQVIAIMGETPEQFWPAIARHIADRGTLDREIVAAVVRVVGRKRLTDALGRYPATAIWRTVMDSFLPSS